MESISTLKRWKATLSKKILVKPYSGPFLALNGPFKGQQNFFHSFDHYQVLDIVILNHNMHNQQNLMHFEQINDQKPHFGPFFGPKWPI